MSLVHNIFNEFKYRNLEEKVYDIANIICFFGMFIVCLIFGFIIKDTRAMYITFGTGLLFIITMAEGNRTNKRHIFAIAMTIIFNFIYAPYMLLAYGRFLQVIMSYFLIGVVYTLCLNEYKTGLILSIIELILYCTFLIFIHTQYSSDYIMDFGSNYRIAYGINVLIFIFVVICVGSAVRAWMLLIKRQSESTDAVNEEALGQEIANDIFLLNISHEIRTPMNSIVGNCNLLLDENINDNVRDYTYQIINSCNALLLILDGLMELARFDADDIDISINEYDLSILIRETVNMVKVKLLESNLKFNVNVNNEIPRFLIGDFSRIRQVVINILNNAIKYTKNGEINLTIDFRQDKDNSIILIVSIKDTGIGIGKDDLGFVFDVDYKCEGFDDNYGIGLGVCKNIIEKMSGDISVYSEISKGSEFVIELPQSYVKDERIEDILEGIEEYSFYQKDIKSDFVLPGINILIVDDNYTNLDVASSLLKKYEANIYTASSGREAVRILGYQKMDIIFLDYMMPELNGVDTLKIIRTLGNNEYERVPVIALSANVVSGVKESFLNAGFDGFLAKPINLPNLKKIMVRFIPEECIKYR